MKKLCILSIICIFLCGCGQIQPPAQKTLPPPQEIVQLHPEDSLSDSENQSENQPMKAIWIPMLIYSEWLNNQPENTFRNTVRNAFQQCADLGINTLFLHVRSYADAYYFSELFPRGNFFTEDYDPFAIMIEEAHALNLTVHAWINPLRAQTEEEFSAMDSRYLLRKWFDDPDKNGTYLVNVDGRYYLNPAYAEVQQFITDGITEILTHYSVEGIHLDDYFYPTTDPNFDEQAFSESSADNLAQWRRNNISSLMQLLYQTTKNYKQDISFSISPQGNIDIDENELYADVQLWASSEGYCDFLIPQIYYGFENDSLPFKQTVELWAEMVTVPELVIGLGTYKTGFPDQWAGSGKNEFLQDSSVIPRELQFALTTENVSGVALYSYSSLFTPEKQVAELVTEERKQIAELLQKNSTPECSGAES